jgi:hypothetical protein
MKVRELHAVRAHLGDPRLHAHVDADLVEELQHLRREALRHGRQDPVGGLDQGDADVLARIDLVEPGGDDVAEGPMQLGRELRPGRSRADHRDVELTGPDRADLRVRPQRGVHEALVEAHRLVLGVEGDGVLGDTRRAEIVGGGAHRHHQRVVGDGALGRDLAPFCVVARRELDGARFPVEPGHAPDSIAEAVHVGVVQVVHRMVADVEAAGCHLVEQRLPDMRPGAIHESDVRALAAPELVAELRHQLEAGSATTDNHDTMQAGLVLDGCHRRSFFPGPGLTAGLLTRPGLPNSTSPCRGSTSRAPSHERAECDHADGAPG